MEVDNFIEERITHALSRYFKVECAESSHGDVLCSISFSNVRFPIRKKDVKIRIQKPYKENYEYIHAVVEHGIHRLLQQITKLR